MNNEPIKTNRSSEFTTQLVSLNRVRRYYVRIGHIATRALMITQNALNKDVTRPSPMPQFIRTLVSIRSNPQSKGQSSSEIGKLVERSNEVLARATTVFPLDIFPSSVTLDRTKLTITRRGLFSSDVMSIRIEDILSVSAAIGPLFGSLTIATRVLSSDDHFVIRRFTREDAVHLKHVIQGFVIARHNTILCDHLEREELIETLMELGRDSNKDRYKHRVISAPQRLLQ
jgi:hypothetical protein